MLTGSFIENRFESHSGHDDQEHSSDITLHAHQHDKKEKSSKTTGCEHIHVHCSSLCQALVFNTNFNLNPAESSSQVTSF